MKKQQKFGSRKGATFIEYALLAGLVAIIVAAAAMIFGEDIRNLFGSTGDQTKKVSEGVKNTDLSSGFNVNNNKNNNSAPSGGGTGGH